jgi:hypothetical protein
MSEQQKDGGVADAADKDVIPSQAIEIPELAGPDASLEARKLKRRATAKAKATADAGDETAKPKRSRTSSRNSKAKNVLTEALPRGDVQQPAGQRQGSAQRLETDSLPPLPSAPMPTPEGIAFMQQHIAFQSALEQRAEMQRARLARSNQASKENPTSATSDRDKLSAHSGGRTTLVPASARDVEIPGVTGAATHSVVKPGKGGKENVIVAGQDIGKVSISEAELQAVHDAEDARLLRQLLDRSRALREPRNATSGAEPAAAIAQADVGALRTIKDVVARKLGLAVVDRNRRGEPDYKVEFDRLAPELKMEAQEASNRKQGAGRSLGVAPDKADDDAARFTAVPDSVRKRFLKVDSDYYFPDRSPAFVDRGARLATRGEHPEVIVALVEIARERGWDSITVKGKETFRRAAWMEAARNGLQVGGYKPTELDLAQLNQRVPRNLIEPDTLKEQGHPNPTSLAKPVDQALSEKLSAFANDKPTLVVKKYPDLVQAYALLDAARKFAEAHMPGHEAQFVAIGKELITQQLQEGREIKGPKVHPDHIGQSRSGRNRPGNDAEKSPQSETLVRER